MANLVTNFSDGAETTLSFSLSAGATSINVDATSTFPTVPFYIVVDPGTDAKREVILVDDSKTATSFSLTASTSRGQGTTSDVAHDAGATVILAPVSPAMTDLHDRVTGHAHGGSTDGAAIAGSDITEASLAHTHDGATGGGAVDGADVTNTPAGNIAATDVQAAINELDTEKQAADATLTALAGTLTAANKVPYATATDTAGELDFKDEDDMSSDSATAVPSQQSVKAFAVHMEARTDAGTTDTLEIGDAGKVVRYTNASAVTATVPPNSSVAFPTGTIINIYSAGAGGVTIAQGAGVTIRNNDTPLVQYGEVSLRKDGTDEWVRVG